MCKKVLLLYLLQMFFLKSSQQTKPSGHVTLEQTTSVTMEDKVAKLEQLVSVLQIQIEELYIQRKNDQIRNSELDIRLSLTSTEAVTLHSDLMQIMQTQKEFQNDLTKLNENVGDLQLESKEFNFIQKQVKTDVGSLQQQKDHNRRQRKRFEKRLRAKIETVNKKTDMLVQDLSSAKINCSNIFWKTEKKLRKIEISVKNNSFEMQKFNENLTDIKTLMDDETTKGKETTRQRFDRLYKIYNISRTKPDRSNILHSQESYNRMDPEFQTTNSLENKLSEETGSGEVGSGEETIPVFSSHSHANYVQKEDLLLELQERDLEINTLLDMYEDLKTGLATMDGRMQEIRLGYFMEKLQESFINFTRNVLTMDQWRMASSQIINSTQVNQDQITGITNMIFNNTYLLRELEAKISNIKSLSYQQFSLLRIHVIKLNNTVQDMVEERNRNHVNRNAQNLPPPVYVHTIENRHDQNIEKLKSKLEEITLQVLYNENRLGKIELKILNESLLECKKVNIDFNQDARIFQIENSVMKMSDGSKMVTQILNQIQRELYQEYVISKNQSDVINVIIQDIKRVDQVFPLIADMQHQIDLHQFMLPEDCYSYYRRGFKDSGIYVINPIGTNLTLQVFCDLEHGNAGWTVIQKRMDGSENFARTWDEYKKGFGDIFGEFWLGNDLIHTLTTSNTSLKIDMIDIHNRYWSVTYDIFSIADEDKNYKLYVNGFHGNSSDSLSYSNGVGFSTHDRDNDASSTNCAMFYTAGWWFKHCHYSNLNGRYRLGMVWYDFNEDEWLQLKYSSMKIKPNI